MSGGIPQIEKYFDPPMSKSSAGPGWPSEKFGVRAATIERTENIYLEPDGNKGGSDWGCGRFPF